MRIRRRAHARDMTRTVKIIGAGPIQPIASPMRSCDMTRRVKIIGAGLAGPEAAWQCARRGIAVELFEMRPGAADSGSRNRRLRRIGLLELAQVRLGKHRAVAAQRRDAASWIAADGDWRAKPPFPPGTHWRLTGWLLRAPRPRPSSASRSSPFTARKSPRSRKIRRSPSLPRGR